jgi:hypothetical protein
MANPNEVGQGINRNKVRVRVGGSGFTTFRWRGQVIAFARQISHTSPTAVGPGAVPIQPMDAPKPLQIITPAASGMGTLVLELYELYGAQVWERLAGLEQTIDLVDIFRTQAAEATPITVTKFIKPPNLGTGKNEYYTEEYHNCVVTNVADGETIEIGTMEVLKQVTIGYTHLTRGGRKFNFAYDVPGADANARDSAGVVEGTPLTPSF